MEQDQGLLSSLLIQFGAAVPVIWSCVEFMAPRGNFGRRVALVAYSWLFSLAMWALGQVSIPEMIPLFQDSLVAEVVVVLILGLGSAAMTHQAHETTKNQALK